MHLTETQIKKIKRAAGSKKGVDLTLSKTQIQRTARFADMAQIKRTARTAGKRKARAAGKRTARPAGKGLHVDKGGGGLRVNPPPGVMYRPPPFIGSWEGEGGSLGSTLAALAPTIAKQLGISALSGLASEGASQIIKKLSGKGGQSGGFLVPQNKINQLLAHQHLLTAKQKKDLISALQSGGSLQIRPTKIQAGGFLGTPLASIGIPLALEAVKGLFGKGVKKTKV